MKFKCTENQVQPTQYAFQYVLEGVMDVIASKQYPINDVFAEDGRKAYLISDSSDSI